MEQDKQKKRNPPGVTRENKRLRNKRKGRVAELLIEGMPTMKLAAKVAEEFQVTERAVWHDIKAVREKVLPEVYCLGDFVTLRSEAIAKAETHYVRCVQDQQHSAGLQTLKWIGELQGLTARQQISDHMTRMRLQLDELRAARNKGDEKGQDQALDRMSLSLDQFNLARSFYGLPAMDDEQYTKYKARFIDLDESATEAN